MLEKKKLMEVLILYQLLDQAGLKNSSFIDSGRVNFQTKRYAGYYVERSSNI